MLLRTESINSLTINREYRERKLIVDTNLTLYTIVGYNQANDRIILQEVNQLHRVGISFKVLEKEFRIVDEINISDHRYETGIDLCSTIYMKENNKNNTETNLMVNETKMEGYIERMIQEHKELVARIEKLHAWVYGDAYKSVHPSEFANECIQLKAMKVYEEALRARLFNAGVKIANGEYLVAVDTMNDEPEDGDTPDND